MAAVQLQVNEKLFVCIFKKTKTQTNIKKKIKGYFFKVLVKYITLFVDELLPITLKENPVVQRPVCIITIEDYLKFQ